MDRRTFLLQMGCTVAGGLWVGCGRQAPEEATTRSVLFAGSPLSPQAPPTAGSGADLSAWIRIEGDARISLFVPESEMGQGIHTAVAMILADELHVPFDRVAVFHAPLDPTAFGRQSTGGSTSIRKGYDAIRAVGAAARDLLVGAAAEQWSVDPATCRVRDGSVVGPADQTASFGALAPLAAARPSSSTPSAAPEARHVGQARPRVDLPAKVNGTAVYGIDVRVEGMVVATVAHCPIFGGRLATVDDTAARRVAGVLDVVEIPTGVAVVAEHTWAATKGREALVITWDDGGSAALSSTSITAQCVALAPTGTVATDDGDAIATLAGAAPDRTIDAVYEVPYLAHTPMEPLGCTAHVREGVCEIWVSTQSPSSTAATAAEITGIPADAIVVHTTMLGGGFGRRSQTDFVADAVHVSVALQRPVKVVWSREDDVGGGWYRPMAYNRLQGAVDDDGHPVAWQHQIVSPSIMRPQWGLTDGLDAAAIEGAANLPYAIGAKRVTWADVELPISVWWWRSVGSSQNAFVTECFFDELCALGGQDPVEARRRLLSAHPGHRQVLEVAAEAAGWGTPMADGRARGVAVHASFGSIVAQVAEVSIVDGAPRVHRVVCAVDCGQVIHPDTIAAQMDSSVAYGLSAALYGEVAIAGGRAVPSNFHDYPVVRMNAMPRVETHLVPSGDPHGGIGEPGLPPIAPAVCNALLALTGTPIRKLPIRLA